MKAIVCLGLSGSGKTTYADKLCWANSDWINVNRDSLRFSLFGATGWYDYKQTRDKENLITAIHEDIIHECYVAGKNVIVSDTHLNSFLRRKMLSVLEHHGYSDIEVKEFPVTLEEALKRNRNRVLHSVPEDVIINQYKQWLKYKGE